MNKKLEPVNEITERDVLVANGVTAICEMLAFSLAEAGDGILLGRPIYQGFAGEFGTRAKVKAVYVSFGDVDQFSPQAAESYERGLLEAENSGRHEDPRAHALASA